MSDGAILDATKFIPDGTPPAGGWPAMIFCHGYGGSKADNLTYAEDLATQGYFTITYSMRGQGASTGLSNLMSTTEMNDFVAFVNYTKAQPNVNTQRVGAIGGSQGGTMPFMAACYYPGILRCIISDVSSPEFATSWIENNSVKMTLLWTVSYDNTIARYNPLVTAFRNWILADTPAKWDSLKYYMPINRDFMNKVGQNTTPILISTVWQDKFFNPHGFLKAIYNMTSPYRLYCGTFNAHGADADADEEDYHSQITSDWIDYYLGDVENGVQDSVKFIYAASKYPRSGGFWTWNRFSSPQMPPVGTENINFYLHPNGLLNNNVNTIYPDTVSFLNDVRDNTLTMNEAVNYEFTGSVFNTKFVKTQINFETPVLAANTRMIGTPYVNIHYMPSTTIAQFNLQIYEVKSGTTPFLIGRANYTDRNLTPNVTKQLSFYGTSFSHTFQAGSKIRVVLTNIDNISNDPFLRTNPYVLPSLKRGYNRIYMNAANPTYIQLPLIGYVNVSVNPISSEVPKNIELMQNYPNPFNPSTTIKFAISEKYSGKNAIMKVYNINGQEIQTLMNDKLKAGTYEIKFDGSNLPSGIYFYTLKTGDYSETKKLMLIK